MRKLLLILCTAALIICSGCGSGAKTVSMYDLCKTMEAAESSLPDMLYASSADSGSSDDDKDKTDKNTIKQNFENISDMEYGKVDSYFVSYSREGKADEITVIAVKDPKDVQEAKESLERHRQNRIKLLQQYEPREVKRMEDGLIFTKAQYAVLIICDHPDGVRKAFENAVTDQ